MSIRGRRVAAAWMLPCALLPCGLVGAGCAADDDGGAPSSVDDAPATTTPPGAESPLDQAGGHDASVSVTYTIEGDGSGSVAGADALADLEDRLIDAVEPAGIGELGGDEFGDGTVTLVLHGPDLDTLWAKVEPILRSYPGRPAWAELRDGGPEQPATRVDL